MPQYDGMVMDSVARRVDERDRSFAGAAAQILDRLPMGGELSAIAAPELVPATRIMVEPPAQFGGWRDLLEPLVQLGLRLAEAPWPESIYEDPRAVGFLGRVINALEPEVRSRVFAMDDSGDLRKLPRASAGALKLDFRAKSFEIAMNDCNRELLPVAQVSDRTVAGFE